MLAHTSRGADQEKLLHLYRSLIRSKLDYGCIVYGSARGSDLLMLDPIQNHALRLCLGAYRTSASSLCMEANEPPLYLTWERLLLQYSLRYFYMPLMSPVLELHPPTAQAPYQGYSHPGLRGNYVPVNILCGNGIPVNMCCTSGNTDIIKQLKGLGNCFGLTRDHSIWKSSTFLTDNSQQLILLEMYTATCTPPINTITILTVIVFTFCLLSYPVMAH